MINIIIIFLPITIIIKHIYYILTADPNDKKMYLTLEKKWDTKLSKIIPVIIFGLGLLLSRHKIFSKELKNIVPYLLLSLILGTLTPFILVFIDSSVFLNNKKNFLDNFISLAFKQIIFCCIVTASITLLIGVLISFIKLYY